METGAIAIHQDHRGGEVQGASGQYPIGWFAVKRFANQQSGAVEVVACNGVVKENGVKKEGSSSSSSCRGV